VPIDRSVLADWMGRTGALIAPVVDHMALALALKQGSTRLYVDETTAPVLDPGRGKTKTGDLWAVLRDGELRIPTHPVSCSDNIRSVIPGYPVT
jgi:transposase